MTAEQFLAFARLFPEPLLLLSSEGRVLAWNVAVTTLLGRPPGELQDRLLTALVTTPPDQVTRYLRDCSRTSTLVLGALMFAAGNGQPALQCRCEGARVRTASPDDAVCVLLRLKPAEEGSRSFHLLNQQIEALHKEIRERKQAEEAERAQREYLQVTLASIGDGVIVTDATGRVTLLNPVAERLTGWTSAAAIGRSLSDVFHLVHAETRQPVNNPATAVLGTGRVTHLPTQTVLLNRDSRGIPIADSAAPIRNTHGALIGVVVVFVDITPRKQTEEALARIHADLRQVAYVSAHDLQEPVRQIGLYTQLLAARSRNTFDAETQEAITFIVDGTKRMQAQFTDLMHYLEVDGQDLGVATIDCEMLLQQAIAVLRDPISTTGATITHDPLPTLVANPAQLQLVLQELLDNALKFRDNAPLRIHVRAEREEGGWRFAVRDNGMGIEPQSADQLFRFFRKLQRRIDYPGTGMGLAICKKIVERHGGRIWIDSQPGEETTVYFTISGDSRQ